MPDAKEIARKKAEDLAKHKAAMAKLGYDERGVPLPMGGADTYAAKHPRRAQILQGLTNAAGLGGQILGFPASLGAGVAGQLGLLSRPAPVTYGIDANGMPLSAQAQSAQGLGSPVEAAPAPIAPVAPNETVVPKTPMMNRGAAARAALRDTILPAISSIHSKYGVSDDDSDTVLNNFIDTAQGRKLSDQALAGQNVSKDALAGYENFVKSWTGSGKQAKQITVKAANPVVVQASNLNSVDDWRKALQTTANNTVVIDGASDKGFMSDKVIIVKGKSSPKFDVEHALDSHQPPVLTPNQFVQALQKAGMSGG